MRAVERCLPSTTAILTLGLETETSLETRGPAGGRTSGLPGARAWDAAGSGRGDNPTVLSRDHKVPASVCSRNGKHNMGVGGLRPQRQGRGCGSTFLAWDHGDLPARLPGRPSGIAGCGPHPPLSSVGRRVGGRAAPLGSRTHHLLSMGPPAPLLGRTPGAACARLDLHVHRADVARLVLSDPQLPVFGWVHFSKQLVHRLDCLQGMEKRGRRQGQQRPGHGL